MALAEEVGNVDVLVNNAGLGRMDGTLAQGTLDDISRTIDTNVTALMVATMAFLPAMIRRGSGHVVNLGSMAGLYPLPSATYGASKAAVHRFCTNLRLELLAPASVTEICPGRVATEFYDVAVTDPQRRAQSKDSGIKEITAYELADTILYAVNVPAHININRIELQPTEQTYGGMSFDAAVTAEDDIATTLPTAGGRLDMAARTVLITGGASGMGAATGEFAAQGATSSSPILIAPGLNASLSSANRSGRPSPWRWRRQPVRLLRRDRQHGC